MSCYGLTLIIGKVMSELQHMLVEILFCSVVVCTALFVGTKVVESRLTFKELCISTLKAGGRAAMRLLKKL